MHRRILQILALAVCLGLLPAAASAKGGPPANKGKSSNQHSSDKDKDKEKHHEDNDRDDRHAGRGHGHEHQAAASNPPGWDKGKKTGWGDCNVPPGLAKQRGCDSHGLSARERDARANHTRVTSRTTQSATASTSRVAQPGQKGAIILQRNGSQPATRSATASTSKAAQPGQSQSIILQRNATRPAAQNKAAAQSKAAVQNKAAAPR